MVFGLMFIGVAIKGGGEMVSGPHGYYLVARGGSRGPCCRGCPKRGAEFPSSCLGHHTICSSRRIFVCRVHIRTVEGVGGNRWVRVSLDLK
jgi:hypothetical protein